MVSVVLPKYYEITKTYEAVTGKITAPFWCTVVLSEENKVGKADYPIHMQINGFAREGVDIVQRDTLDRDFDGDVPNDRRVTLENKSYFTVAVGLWIHCSERATQSTVPDCSGTS
jgi:hypothetical protein